MKLLVVGGAGYVGSHFVRYAQENNYDVVVLDDFSTGHKEAIKETEIIEVNLLDKERLFSFLKRRHFDGVVNFAAKSIVGESFSNPKSYFQNNIVGSLNLLDLMLENDIENIVFSSSAAIFGSPETKKICENHSKKPINPYGESKLMIEMILTNYCRAYKINATALRYFNAAGAHISGTIGESHKPETHLIPNILKSIKNNETLNIFGNDYDTNDGTCIRDYIHVTDLADAHLKSLEYMQKNKGFSDFNLGNESGFSILEILASCQKITNKKIEYKFSARRQGDPAVLVSDSSKAKNYLSWRPKFLEIDAIISTAWRWHCDEKY